MNVRASGIAVLKGSIVAAFVIVLGNVSIIPALASTRSWYGEAMWRGASSGGSWSNPWNWSTYPYAPNNGNAGCDFDARIHCSTVTIDAPVEVRNCTMLFGGITGGDLTVQGTLAASGGSMSGPGTTYVQGQLVLSDAVDRTIGRRLETSGVATWSDSGTIYLAADTGVLSNTGLFDVQNDGVLYSYGGAACVNNSGIFRKSSGTGTSYFYTAFNNSGTVEAQSGTMYFGGTFTQTAGLVSVLPTATITAASTFSANKVSNNGTFLVRGPTTIGDLTSYNVYSGKGKIDVGSYGLALNCAGFVALDGETSLSGGAIAATNGIALGSGASLVGGGSVNAKIAAAFGSTIQAGGDLTLGDSTSYVGFTSDGELYTNSYTVTINDRNTAVLGSLTRLGNVFGQGRLTAGNARSTDTYAHFLLEQGKNLVGRGEVNGNFKNQGDVIGDGTGANERIVFNSPWVVSGKGTFTNTLILGTFSPGESPAVSNGTNQAFAGGVQIELGGTTPGSGDNNHDQINDWGRISLFDSPVLSLLAWNGFVPDAGDEFKIITWQDGLDGTFGSFTVDPWFTSHGIRFDFHYYNIGGAGWLTATAHAVPEPSTLVLLGLAIAVFVGRRRMTQKP